MSPMPADVPDGGAIDRHVGSAIRTTREARRLDVEQLAEGLAVPAMQVRQYEAGELRVPASRLFAISEQLGTPISTFFQGLGGDEGPERGERMPFLELVRLVASLPIDRQRMVLQMARSIASAQLG